MQLHIRRCFIIYLTPVKTQLLQYNLTRDLMLFYHSNKIKAKTYGRDIKPILFWCRYSSPDKPGCIFLRKGHNPNFDTKTAKSPY